MEPKFKYFHDASIYITTTFNLGLRLCNIWSFTESIISKHLKKVQSIRYSVIKSQCTE